MNSEYFDLCRFKKFVTNGPAPLEEIMELNVNLPKSYIDFMVLYNGGEGFIGESYISLWKIEGLEN